MQIKLVKEGERVIGYDMIPNTKDDVMTIATVRNLIFFGFEGTVLKYNGRKMKPINKDEIKMLMWRQADTIEHYARDKEMAFNNQIERDKEDIKTLMDQRKQSKDLGVIVGKNISKHLLKDADEKNENLSKAVQYIAWGGVIGIAAAVVSGITGITPVPVILLGFIAVLSTILGINKYNK